MSGRRFYPQKLYGSMNQSPHENLDAVRDAAADWLMRMRRPEVDEADWLGFEAWLEASPAHPAAYDAVLALWEDLDAAAPALKTALDPAGPSARSRRPPPPMGPSRRWTLAAGLAAAALVVTIVPWRDLTTPTTIYATGKGERRTILLADGTRIDLNAGSRLSVRLGARERRVVIEDAEAVFDVAKDPQRPFLIASGDRTVRVVGTQFDVRRREGHLAVTVARGVVEVRPAADAVGDTVRLTPGRRLDHVEGSAESQVSAAAAEEVFSWRSGRLIYRDRPLREVVADLNRYVATPLKLADERTAQLKFSGVLMVDDEDRVVQRLVLLAPIASVPAKDVILLRAQ